MPTEASTSSEARPGEQVHSFRIAGRDGEKKSLAYSPDGRLLAGTGEDGTQIDVWDTRTHHRSARLTGHMGVVYSVAFSGDGRLWPPPAVIARSECGMWPRRNASPS